MHVLALQYVTEDSPGLISCCVPATYLICFILISTISLFQDSFYFSTIPPSLFQDLDCINIQVFFKTCFDEEFVAIDEQSNVEENVEEYDQENIEQNNENSDFGKIVDVQIKPGKRKGGTHYVTEDNYIFRKHDTK